MKVEKFICLSEKRSLDDCAAVAEACLGEMESEAEVEGVIQRAASEVAEAAAEQRGGDGGDGDLTIQIQVREEECSTTTTTTTLMVPGCVNAAKQNSPNLGTTFKPNPCPY